jgi:hypothetical protein
LPLLDDIVSLLELSSDLGLLLLPLVLLLELARELLYDLPTRLLLLLV